MQERNIWFKHNRLFPWMFQGLIDRYSGLDHKYESLKSKNLLSEKALRISFRGFKFRDSNLVQGCGAAQMMM